MFAKPILISIALACSIAQGQNPQPVFEVASIKAATPQGPRGMTSNRRGGPGTNDPGIYACENCPVSWVLSEAYDLQSYDYAGPDWLQNTRFDFAANVPRGTTKDTFRAMLQNLLADRFKMAVHREKKEMPVYELTVAKNGPKLKESGAEDAPKEDAPSGRLAKDKDGFPILKAGMTMAVAAGHARIRSDRQSMAWLASMLSGPLDSPVIDATGLKANYDYILSWSSEDGDAPPAPSNGTPAAVLEPYRSALIKALQSQLGLKLEHKKGQVEVLVIDHMEKTPTAN